MADMTMIRVMAAIILILIIVIIIMYRTMKDNSIRDMKLLEILICVMEAGNPNLDGHSLHVHYIIQVFYDYLPISYQRSLNYAEFKYASLFHDIGKLGIPKSIMERSGKLDKKDMDIVRRHPEIGVEILRAGGQFEKIEDWMLYHHERVDGKGYYGLKGDEIPLASRIIAIADTYSALTMDRTYKATLPYEEAIMEIRQVAGTQLDKELVALFCEIPKHRLDDCMYSVHKAMQWYRDEKFGERE